MFDLNTFQNVKINSKLEFPHDLDLEAYTDEGLEWRQKKQTIEKEIAELEKEDQKDVKKI